MCDYIDRNLSLMEGQQISICVLYTYILTAYVTCKVLDMYSNSLDIHSVSWYVFRISNAKKYLEKL